MAAPTGILFYDPQAKPLSNAGTVLPGAYLLFYITGTTTPWAVYANGLLTTVLSQTPGQAQPSCTADANGRFNPIYMSPTLAYRVQLYNSAGTLLEDVDPYVVPVTKNALAGQTGLGTATLSDGVGSSTCNFSWVTSAGNTVCTLQMQGEVFASGATGLVLNYSTGVAWPGMSSGNSYHSIACQNNGSYITGVVKIDSATGTLTLYANPVTGAASWTASGTKGIPVGFTITYPIAGMTEH